MKDRLIALLRFGTAGVWFYEGTWLKLLAVSPHQLAVVESLRGIGLPPRLFLAGIGCGETLLGIAVVLGWFPRLLALFQIALVVAMNGIAMAYAASALQAPAWLLVRNLPFLTAVAVVGFFGPGAWTISLPWKTWTKGTR